MTSTHYNYYTSTWLVAIRMCNCNKTYTQLRMYTYVCTFSYFAISCLAILCSYRYVFLNHVYLVLTYMSMATYSAIQLATSVQHILIFRFLKGVKLLVISLSACVEMYRSKLGFGVVLQQDCYKISIIANYFVLQHYMPSITLCMPSTKSSRLPLYIHGLIFF